jgi:hypothetical protein
MIFDYEMIRNVYQRLPEKIGLVRRITNKPLTLTEKILYSHLAGEIQTNTESAFGNPEPELFTKWYSKIMHSRAE